MRVGPGRHFMGLLPAAVALYALPAAAQAPAVVPRIREPEPASPKPAPEPAPPSGGFSFGSYGRVVAASDGRGGAGRDADVVAHGSRIDESTYAELELRRGDAWTPGISTRIVTTLALGDPIFHEDGQFDARIAVRNLYAEASGIGSDGLSFWAGSRMLRGDDIYLLDFWPLDNLNTVGGGVRFESRPARAFAAWHVGLNRVNDPFQTQTIERPAPQNQPGSVTVPLLDRPRLITSLKLGGSLPALTARGGVKAALYGEAHRLPSGEHEADPGVIEELPGTSGVVIGAQLGAYTGEHDGFVNLFLRHARGLAAYGEFGTPAGTAPDRTSEGAHETLLGLAANWELQPVALLAGAYFRSFRDATPEPVSFAHVDEGILVLRPQLFIGQRAGIAVEGSYQAQQRGILDVTTNLELRPSLLRFGLIPFLTPAGPGSFARPHLRLIWAVTRRNDAARSLHAPEDPFSRRRLEQFFGVGAEWWFSSSSYGR